MKPDQLREFETYAAALAAERYRVTCIRMTPGGESLAFVLDKQDGVTRGFTPQEIELHTPEMLRLQERDENIYYTPLSTGRHHILLDDMSQQKLDALVHDSYRPAVVLESSPGNYQAIFTVPKLGTVHDRDVGNRVTEQLNRRYGDPKLSGCIHPHRAPGYENRKPEHRRDDGTYPTVRLLWAERRECEKTLALARQIDGEYQRQAAQNAQQPTPQQRPAVEPAAATAGTIAAFQRHREDVLNRLPAGDVDWSRVDSMIAVRMRVTGHTQGDIEGTLLQCAEGSRPVDERGGHDWDDYAKRTAAYAFSPKGDRQFAELRKYRRQWLVLESRELTPVCV